ncbi:undecaprenyl-phosphate glucose phosphotransferase [Steroidobacter sp. S1-65]|uniref:Undecaprenyl-phosphate glucose phosphotransferase n=1 Tax=Steroidobacter gossypii TaxID=2805490 RepID=A0ABS1X449_9GAMM|nr:undecaprenyl-phosphate glucose phosphotransferase [Steroidobacter gossypii]MBM0108003.1 undecaprenyl-phosphate glucose phosphotransferase [Steroidobacter gossypii]
MSAIPDSAVRPRVRLAGAPQPRLSPVKLPDTSTPSQAAAYDITPPLLFKRQSALAAIYFSLRATAPAAVSILTLYVLAELTGTASTEYFSAVTIIVTILSITLLQSPRTPAAELIAPRRVVLLGLLVRWSVLLLALLLIGLIAGYPRAYSTPVILLWAVATPALLVPSMLVLDEIARRVLCRPSNARKVVFAGYNKTSEQLAERFARHAELCMHVHGFFDDRSAQRLEAADTHTLLGPLSQLPEYIKKNEIDVIFIALPLRHIRRVQNLLDKLGDTTVSLYYLPDVMISDQFQARTGEILGVPVIAMRESPFHGYQGAAKRLMDLVISASVLAITGPLLLAIAAAIKLTSKGPVLFRQRRYGLDGREIVIYKFRTMTVTEDSGWLDQASRNDARVTPLGKFLRRCSLDEMPQLINVLQGRMSLVGPRPHAVGHNEEYRRLIKGYMVRHKVPPGITGLAQIKGFRGATPRLQDMQGRVHYDLEYLRKWSLWLDLKILFLTVPKLFNTDKAY